VFVALKKTGVLVILGVVFLLLVIAALFLPDALPEISEGEAAHVFTRLFGLYGFLFLGVATLITPFLREVKEAFGKPFLHIHHAFSVLGIVLITLHPVFNAIDRLSLVVFVPNFASWEVFWRLAGRPAFILIYIAFAAALLRLKAPKYWKFFHALMYVALLFGIVHANLIGDDFGIFGIMLIFDALFAASISSFAYKRYKNYQIKRKHLQPAEN
jgi:predicted ferric reductase